MSTRVKFGIIWGAIITGVIATLTGFLNLFEGNHRFANTPNGHHFKGGGYRHHELISGQQGFHWMGFLLFLIIGLAVLVLIVRWFKKKSKVSSMQQFIDTSFVNSQVPVTNNNANILDQWEKNLVTKKENE